MTPAGTWAKFLGYFAHPQPRVALGGTVAMIVVGNQPFYPFYVWSLAGGIVPAAFLTWLSTPFFLAAPALARTAPWAGRVLLLVAAIGNTIVCAVGLGPASGAELFYLPCLLLAWAMFPPGQRGHPVAWAAASILAGLGIERLLGSLTALDAQQSHRLAIMHAVGAGCLTALIAIQAIRIGRAEGAISRSGL